MAAIITLNHHPLFFGGGYCTMHPNNIQAAEMSDVRRAQDDAKDYAKHLFESMNSVIRQHEHYLKVNEENMKCFAREYRDALAHHHKFISETINASDQRQDAFQKIHDEHFKRIQNENEKLQKQCEGLLQSAQAILSKNESIQATIQ